MDIGPTPKSPQTYLFSQATSGTDLEDDWVLLPYDTEEEIYITLNDSQKLKQCIEQLTDNIQDWKLIEESKEKNQETSLTSEEENKKYSGYWSLSSSLPLLTLTTGTLQKIKGNSTNSSFLEQFNLFDWVKTDWLKLKSFSGLLPVLPIFGKMAKNLYEDQSNSPISQKILKIFKEMDKAEIIFLFTSCAISVATAGTHHLLINAAKLGFEMTGQNFLQATVNYISPDGQRKEADETSSIQKSMTAAIAITEGVKSYGKTFTHTVEELTIGILLGIVSLGITDALASLSTKNKAPSPTETEKT